MDIFQEVWFLWYWKGILISYDRVKLKKKLLMDAAILVYHNFLSYVYQANSFLLWFTKQSECINLQHTGSWYYNIFYKKLQ